MNNPENKELIKNVPEETVNKFKNLTKEQLLSNARLIDEPYELYKERRKFVNKYNKEYLKGRKVDP